MKRLVSCSRRENVRRKKAEAFLEAQLTEPYPYSDLEALIYQRSRHKSRGEQIAKRAGLQYARENSRDAQS